MAAKQKKNTKKKKTQKKKKEKRRDKRLRVKGSIAQEKGVETRQKTDKKRQGGSRMAMDIRAGIGSDVTGIYFG